MKLKFLVLSLLMAGGANVLNAKNDGGKFDAENNKHEFRISVSDGLTQGSVDILGLGIEDAITGTKTTDSKYSLIYGFGYRYAINRFRVGADLGFGKSSDKQILPVDNTPSYSRNDLKFLVLPTAEFVYFKHGLFELYGTAAAGVNMTRHTEKGFTEAGKRVAGKADFSTSFAYQVNPVAVRVGNNRIGGFVEAGIGHKGFLTAGVSLKF